MKKIEDEISSLKRLVKMLAAQFGKNSEIVLHDLSKDYRHTIVAIENNWITGREIGGSGTNLGLEVLSNPPNANGDLYNYFTHTTDGHMLRSSTFYFRDEDGNVIGALCINTDVTNLVNLQESLQEIIMQPQHEEVEEVFASSVDDLFKFLIKQSKVIVDKPIGDMTKEDKIKIVRFLDSKGFFLITRAGDEACTYLEISKYTLYKYLGVVREENEKVEEDDLSMP